jgi:hypothetical protein
LEAEEPALAELAALRRIYREPDGLIGLDGDRPELLRAMGERGGHLACRLGLDANSGPDELAQAAAERLSEWRARGDAFGASEQELQIAEVMVGTYERLLHHAQAAKRHLEVAL